MTYLSVSVGIKIHLLLSNLIPFSPSDEKQPQSNGTNTAVSTIPDNLTTASDTKLHSTNPKSKSESSLTHVEHSTTHPDGKRELTEEDAYDELGYSLLTWRKWMILSVIFIIQVSINFNAAVYLNVVQLLSDHFNISLQAAKVGQMIFLVAYTFGSEFWASWSEELGRWPILQASLFLVNSKFSSLYLSPYLTFPQFGKYLVHLPQTLESLLSVDS